MTPKLLVVDDSGLARRSLKQILTHAGYDVVEATDGMSALEQYFVEKPDLVLLDLVMSGMYGLDVLQKLREMDPEVRVVVVSADVQTSSQQLAAAGGASGFVHKPIDPQQVLEAVSGALKAR